MQCSDNSAANKEKLKSMSCHAACPSRCVHLATLEGFKCLFPRAVQLRIGPDDLPALCGSTGLAAISFTVPTIYVDSVAQARCCSSMNASGAWPIASLGWQTQKATIPANCACTLNRSIRHARRDFSHIRNGTGRSCGSRGMCRLGSWSGLSAAGGVALHGWSFCIAQCILLWYPALPLCAWTCRAPLR